LFRSSHVHLFIIKTNTPSLFSPLIRVCCPSFVSPSFFFGFKRCRWLWSKYCLHSFLSAVETRVALHVIPAPLFPLSLGHISVSLGSGEKTLPGARTPCSIFFLKFNCSYILTLHSSVILRIIPR